MIAVALLGIGGGIAWAGCAVPSHRLPHDWFMIRVGTGLLLLALMVAAREARFAFSCAEAIVALEETR